MHAAPATEPVRAPSAAPVRVQACLDALGDDAHVLRATPEGLDAVARTIVLHDPGDAHLLAEGAVVLAVGVEPGERARLLVAAAEAGGAAAIVLRPGATGAPSPSGPVLVELRAGVPWAACHQALLGAFAPPAVPPEDDLQAVANTIAAAAGGATVIEDVRRRVLAFSTLEDQPVDAVRRGGIVDGQMPIVPEAEHEYQAIAQTPGPQRFPPIAAIERGGRLGVAVRAGGLLLGSIWVVDADGALPDTALRALGQAADLAALSLLRAAERTDPEERLRSDDARHLLTGEVHLVRDGTWIRGFHHAVVVAVALDAPGRSNAFAYARRCAATLGTYLSAYRGHAVTTTLGDRAYALIGLAGPDEDVLPLLRDAAAHLDRVLRVPLRMGVGGASGDTAELVRSRREAEDVLALPPGPQVVTTMDQVRSTVLLGRLRAHAREGGLLDEPRLLRLLEHDAAHGTDYAGTLRTYLDAFGDVARAAEVQGVHANTVRYRLRRVRELLDVSFDAPDDRLLLQLQLRLLDAP